MNEARGQLLCGITLHAEIERSTSSSTPAQNMDFTLNTLSSDNHYFPPIWPYVSFLSVCDCTWNPLLWLDLFLPLAVSYVQLSRLHFHPTSDAMWRARGLMARNSCETRSNSWPQAHGAHHVYPCLHVQIEDFDSWVKSFQHRLLMISNNFCSSAWVQVWGTAGAALICNLETSASR